MVTAMDEQIKSLFELSSLKDFEIAESLGIEVEAVRHSLACNSVVFRQQLKKDDVLFTKNDAELAAQVIRNLLHSDCDNVKLKAAKYTIDEQKGRNDVRNVQTNLNININLLNDSIRKAKAALGRTRELKRVVDVDSTREEAA